MAVYGYNGFNQMISAYDNGHTMSCSDRPDDLAVIKLWIMSPSTSGMGRISRLNMAQMERSPPIISVDIPVTGETAKMTAQIYENRYEGDNLSGGWEHK